MQHRSDCYKDLLKLYGNSKEEMVISSLGGGEDFMEEAHLNRIWPSKRGEEEIEVMGRV